MSKLTTDKSPRESFKAIYGLCRQNRTNIHFQGQTFRFAGGGCVYIGETTLIIKRDGWLRDRPAFYADFLINAKYSDLDNRRYFLSRSKDQGRIPLP